ncbi:MAG: DUF4058 family protein [Gemmataceae bacterium]
MPSPFPGMDPFIEACGLWGDFHGSMVVAMRAQFNERLPREFVASIDLYVWVGSTTRAATAPTLTMSNH